MLYVFTVKQKTADGMRISDCSSYVCSSDLSERPAVAEARTEVGHREGDLIIGSDLRAAIITVFDRKSRHLWMASLRDGRTAPKTLKGLTELLERIPPGLRHTLTWDHGSEMAGHAELAHR